MPSDALGSFADQAVITSTTTHGTVDLGRGNANGIRTRHARWTATAGSAQAGTASVYPVLEHSDDLATWSTIADGTAYALALTSAGSLAKEVGLAFNSRLRYVRGRTVVVGGTSPTLNVSMAIASGAEGRW